VTVQPAVLSAFWNCGRPRLDVGGDCKGGRAACCLLPKFQCEFNLIEMYWGVSKHYTDNRCDYSFQGFQAIIPTAVDLVPLEAIRRYAWMAFR